MCEYSKFRIESNSYLLFDSIRNWRSPVRACVLPAPGLDRGIWLRYNGGRQTQHMVSWVLALLSVFLPRDASAERGNATVSRPSVRLSVCLWRLGISNT